MGKYPRRRRQRPLRRDGFDPAEYAPPDPGPEPEPEPEPELTPEQAAAEETSASAMDSVMARLPQTQPKRFLVISSPVWGLILFVIAFVMCGSDPEAQAAAEVPTPTPAAAVGPTPTRVVWSADDVVPAVRALYTRYRLSHFLFEYGYCFSLVRATEGEEVTDPGETPTPAEAVYMGPDMEAEVLVDIPAAVHKLLIAYDEGLCYERPEFAQKEGRGKWLRLWAGRGESAIEETPVAETQ